MNFDPILCRIGLHRWQYRPPFMGTCLRCGRWHRNHDEITRKWNAKP